MWDIVLSSHVNVEKGHKYQDPLRGVQIATLSLDDQLAPLIFSCCLLRFLDEHALTCFEPIRTGSKEAERQCGHHRMEPPQPPLA